MNYDITINIVILVMHVHYCMHTPRRIIDRSPYSTIYGRIKLKLSLLQYLTAYYFNISRCAGSAEQSQATLSNGI